MTRTTALGSRYGWLRFKRPIVVDEPGPYAAYILFIEWAAFRCRQLVGYANRLAATMQPEPYPVGLTVEEAKRIVGWRK